HTDSPTTPGLTTETHPFAEAHASTERPPTMTNETNNHHQGTPKMLLLPETLLYVYVGSFTGLRLNWSCFSLRTEATGYGLVFFA
nr:NADP-specific glutamate dehydrogenase isoform X1 [Tanacetum cinerariifolium]